MTAATAMTPNETFNPNTDANVFGYNFVNPDDQSASDLPNPDGQPLLEENETAALDDFFTHASAHTDLFGGPTFEDTGWLDKSDPGWSSMLNYDVPTVHRVHTSLPNSTQPPFNFGHGGGEPFTYSSAPEMRGYTSTATPADLNAATALHYGSQQAYMTPDPSGRRYHSISGYVPTTSGVVPASLPGWHHQQPTATANDIHATLSAQVYPRAVHGSIDSGIVAHVGVPKRPMRFGSDGTFNAATYFPPPGHAVADQQRFQLASMHSAIRPEPASVGSTVPSSPTVPRREWPTNNATELPTAEQSQETSDDEYGGPSHSNGKRKRNGNGVLHGNNGVDLRSIGLIPEPDHTDHEDRKPNLSINTSSSNHRPSKSRRISGPPATPDALQTPSTARRRSPPPSASEKTPKSAKPPRENLTDEQKRSNHIMSEQKRRNLIKQGFESLHDMVPELKNGGLSKSATLMTSADFLVQVVQMNARLRRAVGMRDDEVITPPPDVKFFYGR